MVGAGIFVVIGEAGAIAGNLLTVSFLAGGVIALLCGYSLSKLAIRYPSRGGIIEYLVQSCGEGVLSGTLGILFYFAQLVALAAVAKSFSSYAATYMSEGVTPLYSNIFSLGVLLVFVGINLAGASKVAEAENIIVIVKLASTALLATASAINATLYVVTQISYTLAKEGDLPEIYEHNIFHNTEGLAISALLIIPMILFFNLGQIAVVASIAVLLSQGVTQTGHLFKCAETGADILWVAAAAAGAFTAAGFAITYTSKSMPDVIYYIAGIFFLAYIFEILLRRINLRTVSKQIVTTIKAIENRI